MNKVIRICLLIIICICFFGNSVNAASTNVFSITNATGSKGDEVTVIISLEKELEFAAADIIIEYDTSKLEYVKYTNLDIFSKSAMNIVKNNTDTGKIAIGYVSNPNSADLNKKPGQMLSITFKIKNDSTDSARLNLKCTSLKNDNGDNIEVADIQSEIKIITNTNNTNTNNNNNNNNNSNNNNSTIVIPGNNNSNTNSNTNGNTNINVIEVKENNPKNSNSVLPYTGNAIGIISLLIILFTIISIYFYKKFIYLRNI